MNALEHASLCIEYAKDLYSELKVIPVLSFAFTDKESKEKNIVYCHPDDVNKNNVNNFKYPHREL